MALGRTFRADLGLRCMASGPNLRFHPDRKGNAMRNLLEQADASRQTASELRQRATDLEVPELIVTLKLAERLEGHAAELEYRWLAIGSSSKSNS